MKGKTHDLNHDLTFSADTINCVCHSIRSMFRVVGIYNFAAGLNSKNFDIKVAEWSLIWQHLPIGFFAEWKHLFYLDIDNELTKKSYESCFIIGSHEAWNSTQLENISSLTHIETVLDQIFQN